MNSEEIKSLSNRYIMKTYNRLPIALVKGEGCRVWDAEGNEYMDFVAGLAVNSLGHCHPAVVEAIRLQATQLMHCSNLYYIENQAKLAKVLVENSDFDRVFFCNSGAEANEAAIKLARRYSQIKKGTGRYEIITALNSFHGRTLATVTATGQTKYQKGFEPLPQGFRYVEYNNIDALMKAVTDKTCAIMLEPVQGEGGVYPATAEYMAAVREICDDRGILLILDEVQTGIGRCGRLFAYQLFDGLKPDIITIAKALGGGTAIGAMLATEEVASGFEPGNHASTFGGNPLACAAAYAAVNTMIEDEIPKNAERVGGYIMKRFEEMKGRCGSIKDIRGRGLMIGVELSISANEVVSRCLEKRLLINGIADRILRIIPPLVIDEKDADRALEIIEESILKTEKKY